ncbi:MAG: YicC family protein [Synergistaceae bacterium]|nr:YicC family protein [Synergistaceae bacterium]
MLLSMTGFGNKSYDFPWGTVIFEASSTNHKYQDFSVRLPVELASLENRLLNLLRTLVKRGKVRLSATIAWNPGSDLPTLSEEGLINLYNQIKRITRRNNLELSNDITNLLLIPGLFGGASTVAERAALENPELWDSLAKDAIESMIEMKKSEGEKIKIVLKNNLSDLEISLEDMKARWEIARDAALESIRTRIETVLEKYNLELDEPRIAEEVTLAADRWDVTEESDRLEAHIEKFKIVLNEDECSGKKLDFLIQEIIRELNTMGSKVADSEFRWLVVNAKTCVEKMREQIQNVE